MVVITIFTILALLVVYAGVNLARGLNRVIQEDLTASADAEEQQEK